jgi:hypothetical protein
VFGKKDGKFHELHAHRDGKFVHDDVVNDPKWGSFVRHTQGTCHQKLIGDNP